MDEELGSNFGGSALIAARLVGFILVVAVYVKPALPVRKGRLEEVKRLGVMLKAI